MEPTIRFCAKQLKALYSMPLTIKSLGRLLLLFTFSPVVSGQISFDVDITQDVCPGDMDGIVEITNVVGGVPPYMYSNDNGMTYQMDPEFDNLDTSFFLFKVKDDNGVVSDSVRLSADTPPTAECRQESVGLTYDGMAFVAASVFNNGSTDNCNHRLWYKVRRMDASMTCVDPNNPDNDFSDSVKVCCDDLFGSDTIIVVFRVYDRDPEEGPVSADTLVDRFSECMVSLAIQDNLPPEIISCPDNSVADCREDLVDLSRFGEPEVRDNCSIADTSYTVLDSITTCRVGKIIRKWVYTDSSGLQDSCSQEITVINSDPFDGTDTFDLRWPSDTTLYGCDLIAASHPDSTGVPFLADDECSQVTYDWDDDVFQFAPDACVKIRRHWTVVDWCQYERGGPRTPANGIWTYTQEIKLLDTIPPVLDGVESLEVLSYAANCDPIMVDVPSITVDDCADSVDMDFKIIIDLFSDGINEDTLDGADASGIYPLGIHLITYVVDDKCNNQSRWTTELVVVDGKAPSAIMINRLIVPLTRMANGGMAIVNAKQFDLKSFDNCTPRSKLKFSFSQNVNDTVRVFDCDTLGPLMVEIFITDEAQNYSVISNFVVIQDNDNICPLTVTSQLLGAVKTPGENPVEGVQVQLGGGNYHQIDTTDISGLYAFSKINTGKEIEIRPKSPSDWMNGISAKDIILIQQHLLGLNEFTAVNDMIAADVDRSGSISTRDIIWLRKMILGLANEIPGSNSWRFIDAEYQIKDPSKPLTENFPEYCTLTSTSGLNAVNFKAIKLGDVSGDLNAANGGLQVRSNIQDWQWHLVQEGDHNLTRVKVVSGNAVQVGGFQVDISNPMFKPGLLYELRPNSAIANDELFWTFIPDGIRILYTPTSDRSFNSDDPILEFSFSDQLISEEPFTISETLGLQSEYYTDQLINGRITIEHEKSMPFEAVIAPNPNDGSTVLSLSNLVEGEYTIAIHSLTGIRLSEQIWDPRSSGIQTLSLRMPGHMPDGVYLIKVLSPDGHIDVLKWHLIR